MPTPRRPAHHLVRHSDPAAYPCAMAKNRVFSSLCPGNVLDDDLECNVDAFMVCPFDGCNISICNSCWRHGSVAPKVRSLIYKLSRHGLFRYVGMLLVIVAQTMYMPTLLAALSTVFCHVRLSCQYPTCYDPATPMFMFMSVWSVFTLFFVGFGMVGYLWYAIYRRKLILVHSGILDQYVYIGDDPDAVDPDGLSGKDLTFYELLQVDCPVEVWSRVMSFDNTMFKPLYQQYEMRNMLLYPSLFVFKALLLIVILFVAEPNSTGLLAAAAFVELVQLAIMIFASALVNPWIHLLTKCGSIHQITQLGLSFLDRAVTFSNPNNRVSAVFMVMATSAYLSVVILVIFVVCLMPTLLQQYTAWQEKRTRRKLRKEKGPKASVPWKRYDSSDDEGSPPGANMSVDDIEMHAEIQVASAVENLQLQT